MAQYSPSPDPLDGINDEFPIAYDEFEEGDTVPSLPIILFSAASAIGTGIISFYTTYAVLGLTIQISAGLSTLGLLFVLGLTAAGLSIVSGSSAIVSNISFSCGLIVLALLFFCVCGLAGAIAATLIVAWGV